MAIHGQTQRGWAKASPTQLVHMQCGSSQFVNQRLSRPLRQDACTAALLPAYAVSAQERCRQRGGSSGHCGRSVITDVAGLGLLQGRDQRVKTQIHVQTRAIFPIFTGQLFKGCYLDSVFETEMWYLGNLKASTKQEVDLQDLGVPVNKKTRNIWIISFLSFILLFICIWKPWKCLSTFLITFLVWPEAGNAFSEYPWGLSKYLWGCSRWTCLCSVTKNPPGFGIGRNRFLFISLADLLSDI